jgi:hypothetical protein
MRLMSGPGQKRWFDAPPGHFRSTPINGNRKSGSPASFRASRDDLRNSKSLRLEVERQRGRRLDLTLRIPILEEGCARTKAVL